jgi:hypothetical protein
MPESANDKQIGGTHYSSTGQHWDYATYNFGRGYLKGQVTKYVYRWRKKHGIQDLQKALHFLQKLDEVSQPDYKLTVITAQQAAELNSMQPEEAMIMHLIVEDTQTGRDSVKELIEKLIAAEPTRDYVDQS